MGAGASLGDAASIPDGKTAQWTELVKLGIQYSGIIKKVITYGCSKRRAPRDLITERFRR